jgi:hypothetical protein
MMMLSINISSSFKGSSDEMIEQWVPFVFGGCGRLGRYDLQANRQCMMAELVGLLAALLLVANALLQLALAAGVRWNNAVYRGKVAQDAGSRVKSRCAGECAWLSLMI